MIKPSVNFLNIFKRTPGAVSVSEAICIMNLADQVPEGTYIDCGSHHGKSSIAAAFTLPRGILKMIDPVYDLNNLEAWKHSVQKHPSNHGWSYINQENFKEKVISNIQLVSELRIKPVLVGDYSEKAIINQAEYSWAFIDSNDHCDGMAIREAKLLEDRMVSGGIISFHDFLNQFQDPKTAYDYLVSTGKFEPIEIPWEEIKAYVKENDLEKGNDSWHAQETEFPCFVGALRRK